MMREWIVKHLLRLVIWVLPKYLDGTLLADTVIEVGEHVAKNHRQAIRQLAAAYYERTDIPPEEAVIVINWDKHTREWTLCICPQDQDFEMEEA